ncbi:Rpp20 subunit of nuclear RNase MRP and P-domain-containing protein [Thermoascus aurantiacus ATCC 26904]
MAKGTLQKELHFEKKNKDLLRLPKYARIKKRPIPHPPAASPYAGPSVPKVVYVSTKTPFMSAAKRVQKLLRHAERRATAGVDIGNGRMSEKERIARMAQGQENLKREEVFIKATGRAIEKALSVGRWFEQRADEYAVRVKTGSVLVVDDIEEDEEEKRRLIEQEQKEKQKQEQQQQQQGQEGEVPSSTTTTTTTKSTDTEQQQQQPDSTAPSSKSASKKRKRRAKSTVSTDAELPETRTRWVNMVEIAVTLK